MLEEELARSGKQIPPAINGYMMIDTGAEKTCISDLAASQLGLIPTRTVRCYGAGGETTNAMVFARLVIGIAQGPVQRVIVWEQEVQTVRDLEKHPESRGLRVNDQPARLIGLLGRDILRRANVQYNGIEGKVHVTFDGSWLKQMDLQGLAKSQ